MNLLQYGIYSTYIAPGSDELPIVGLILVLLVPYLLGSINSAVLISRLLYRDDVRKYGSGNAGLTNMLRTFGKRAAVLTLLGDILKTVLAIFLAGLFLGFRYRMSLSFNPACYIAGLACVIGHIKPVFYGFRGGKGVLCASTAILLLSPPVFLVLFLTFVLIVWMTRYISLGSIVSAAFLPLALQGYMQAFVFTGDEQGFFEGGIVLFGFAFAIIIVFCHRANIKRLWNHEENKFSLKGSGKARGEDKNDK